MSNILYLWRGRVKRFEVTAGHPVLLVLLTGLVNYLKRTFDELKKKSVRGMEAVKSLIQATLSFATSRLF